jgi:hypothetical protein
MELVSSYNVEIELTLEQRLELAEKSYSMFDIFDFGFGTESILPIENYHNMIDTYYPGVPRKTIVKIINIEYISDCSTS